MMDVDMGEHVCMEGGELFCPQNNGGDIRKVRERFGIEVVRFGPPLHYHVINFQRAMISSGAYLSLPYN